MLLHMSSDTAILAVNFSSGDSLLVSEPQLLDGSFDRPRFRNQSGFCIRRFQGRIGIFLSSVLSR